MTHSYAPAMLRVLCFAAVVEAYSVITTSCSTPNATANFVTSPNSRGTLDILWSSLFTIIACTWTVQHPNVPEQRIDSMSGWKWWLRRLCQSAWQMLVTVFAPEILISAAWHDLEAARRSHRDEKMKEFALDDGVEWTLAHSFYANMGGFVIRGDPCYAVEHHHPYHLNADNILTLRKLNILGALPDISKEELFDKSEGDWLVKAIAVCQILWTILEISVRLVGGLGVSQLEVAVLAFAVCAVGIYAIYWFKPKCVTVATTVYKFDGPIPSDILKLLKRRRERGISASYLTPLSWGYEQPQGSPIAFDEVVCGKPGSCTGLLVSAIITSVFGGLHFLAWNSAFPTVADQWVWRAASIYTVVFGAILLIQRLVCFSGLCLQIVTCVYVVARLVIIVEVFRTLFFLPPDAFVSTWTSHLPHFG